MAMPAPLYYTAEMVLALPDDGNRYETVHGELLVTPSPRALHQLALERVVLALAEYLRREPVGALWFAPADISWSPDTLVQPDCFVVPLDEARTLDWARMKTLLLAVEVLSPTTARADRFTKRRLYQEQRIPTCAARGSRSLRGREGPGSRSACRAAVAVPGLRMHRRPPSAEGVPAQATRAGQ